MKSIRITRLLVVLLPLILLTTLQCKKDESGELPETDPDISGWYFRAVSGWPIAITYEPVVLFKDGTYVEVEDQPVEDLDKEADKKDRPYAWGTWRKDGGTWHLTNNKGQVSEYELDSGEWYPAYPYSENVQLASGYENTTGGDYGNGTNALFKERIEFPEKGYFYHSTDGGILTPGSAAWNQTEAAGTYTIKGHTIEMKYNSGKSVRLSFAFGSSGNPPRPSNDLIFVGGDVFVAD